MSFDPTPRPALRRASDGAAHPTAPAAPAAPPRAFTGDTGDAHRPAKSAKPEKTAKLRVQVPRSLKASLQAQAKQAGISLDALVERMLRQG